MFFSQSHQFPVGFLLHCQSPFQHPLFEGGTQFRVTHSLLITLKYQSLLSKKADQGGFTYREEVQGSVASLPPPVKNTVPLQLGI